MVAARGGLHSLGLALSLASPGSLRCPPPRRLRAGVCAREGEGVGGVGGGVPVPGDPRREAEAARDSGKPWTSRGCRRR